MERFRKIAVPAKVRQKAEAAVSLFSGLSRKIEKILFYNPAEHLVPAKVVSISLADGKLDVVLTRRFISGYSVLSQKHFSFDTGRLPLPEEVASSASAALKEFGTGLKEAVLVIPRSMVIFKAANLPAAVRGSISEVIRYEFDRFTPFSSDDALYDFRITGEGMDCIEFLLAACKAEPVNEYVRRLGAAGISIRHIDFESSALSAYISFVSGLESFMWAEISPMAFSYGISANGQVLRHLFRQFSGDDDAAKASEIEAVLTALKKEMAPVEQCQLIALFGHGADSIRQAIITRARLPFKTPSELGNVGRVAAAKVISPSAVGSSIACLKSEVKSFNLLLKGKKAEKGRPYIMSALLSVALVSVIVLYLFVPFELEKHKLKGIEKQIAKLRSDAMSSEKVRSDIEAIEHRSRLADNFKQERYSSIDLMKELTTIIPKSSWLTRVRFSGSQVNIEGYAGSASGLISVLEASKFFRNAEFASPTFRDAQMNMDRFQIKMEIREKKQEAVQVEKR